MSDAGVIIIGAGHGGDGATQPSLPVRRQARPIRLIGEEPLAPYQRPPLSKAWPKSYKTATRRR